VVESDQIIVAAGIPDAATDVRQLCGMPARAEGNAAVVRDTDAVPGAVVADAGYRSDDTTTGERPGRKLFIVTRKDHEQRAEPRAAPPPRGRIPKNISARERMDRKPRTTRGRAIHTRRGQTVEPVFGHVKDGQGSGRFSMRGSSACRGELPDAAVHTLRKLHREPANTDERRGRARVGTRETRPPWQQIDHSRSSRPDRAVDPAHAPGSTLFSNRLRGAGYDRARRQGWNCDFASDFQRLRSIQIKRPMMASGNID
jgi:hypothetical protein